MLTVLVATLVVFALALTALSLGWLLSGRCLRGSCGGRGAETPEEARISCAGCRNRRTPGAGD